MGCKGLWSFLSSVVKTEQLKNLENKILVIDIMLYIHKYVIGIRNSGADIRNSRGYNVNHLYAIYNIVKNITENKIKIVCVFDGKAPDIKKDSIDKRRLNQEIANDKCEEMKNNNETDTEEYIKQFKRSFSVNSTIIEECKLFLKYMGVPYITSCEEADSQCAVIAHYYQDRVAGVLSEDSDILLFGSTRIYRDIDFKNKTVKVLDLNDVINYLQFKTDSICPEKKLNFTIDNFIDFTIILGNNYTHGVRCSGGNNRDKLFEIFVMHEFDMIKYIAHLYQINAELNQIKYYIPEKFIEKWVQIKNNYSNAATYHPSTIDINMSTPDISNIEQFMNDNNFNEVQINNLLVALNVTPKKEVKIVVKPKQNDEWKVVSRRKVK